MSINDMNVDLPLSPSPSPPAENAAEPTASNGGPAGVSAGAIVGAGQARQSPQTAAPQVQDEQEATRMELETRVRKVIDQLFDVATFTADVPEGQEEQLMDKIQETIGSLANVMNIAPQLKHSIPMDILELVDTGRNPDLHTRSLLGRLANDNQQMLGQNMAMGDYHEKLQAAMAANFPEMAEHLSDPAAATSTGAINHTEGLQER